uniref:Eukaryotic peptide chain release factor subunit 1 n=1 Tax=Gouania willdenowi TaxID=441366 RepID=A0A8C5D8Y1_GOUWI
MVDDPSAVIKSLEAADQISRVSKMYADEFGINSNIKSRVNRLSVLKAITLVRQRLKLYNKPGSYASRTSKRNVLPLKFKVYLRMCTKGLLES